VQRVGVLLLVGLVGCAVRLCYLCALVRPRVPGVSVCDPAPPGVFELDLGPLTVGLTYGFVTKSVFLHGSRGFASRHRWRRPIGRDLISSAAALPRRHERRNKLLLRGRPSSYVAASKATPVAHVCVASLPR
jgi:hypothetical protein